MISQHGNAHWLLLRYVTAEWSWNLMSSSPNIRVSHFILPDLPTTNNVEHQQFFLESVPKAKRIVTIAAANHNRESLIQRGKEEDFGLEHVSKYLVVGGNHKGKGSGLGLTSIDALRILQEHSPMGTEIWGVTNPNDESSIRDVEIKIESGVQGFVTQPLLSSRAIEIFKSYPRHSSICYIAGVAFPKSVPNLMLWLKLLGQQDLLQDELFKQHLEYFSDARNSNTVSWVKNELHTLYGLAIDGVHFMPINNIAEFLTLTKECPSISPSD
jgi:5,10-methylenetetrahydrofolate reductase